MRVSFWKGKADMDGLDVRSHRAGHREGEGCWGTAVDSSPGGEGTAPSPERVLAQGGEQRVTRSRTPRPEDTKLQAVDALILHVAMQLRLLGGLAQGPGAQGWGLQGWVGVQKAEASMLEGEGKKAGTWAPSWESRKYLKSQGRPWAVLVALSMLSCGGRCQGPRRSPLQAVRD